MEFNKDITWKAVKKKDKRNKRKITGKPSQNNIEYDSIDHESLSKTLSEITGMEAEGYMSGSSSDHSDPQVAEGFTEPQPIKKTKVVQSSEISNLISEVRKENSNPDSERNEPFKNIKSSNVGNNDNFIDDPLARHVYITGKSDTNNSALGKLSSFAISDGIEELIGDFEACKKLKSGTILVECNEYAQVKVLLKELKAFHGIPVEAQIAFNINTVRGVVRDASLCDISTELLLEKLKSQGVVDVRPIVTGQNKTRTEYTILTFRLEELPEKILFGRESKPIVPYRTKVIQCTKCWYYGHRPEQCSRTKACEKCATKGTEHSQENCQINPIKCINCSKEHKATDKNCQIYKKQRAIAKIRDEHKVGYKSAEDIYNNMNKNTSATINVAQANNNFTAQPNANTNVLSRVYSRSYPAPGSSATHSIIYPTLGPSVAPSTSSLASQVYQNNLTFKGALMSPQKRSQPSFTKRSKRAKTEKDLLEDSDGTGYSSTDSDEELLNTLKNITGPKGQNEVKSKNQSSKIPNTNRDIIIINSKAFSLSKDTDGNGKSEIGVQTDSCTDRSVQTEPYQFKIEKNIIGSFLKDLTINVLCIEQGNIVIKMKPLSIIVNRHFDLDIDHDWVLNAMQ